MIFLVRTFLLVEHDTDSDCIIQTAIEHAKYVTQTATSTIFIRRDVIFPAEEGCCAQDGGEFPLSLRRRSRLRLQG